MEVYQYAKRYPLGRSYHDDFPFVCVDEAMKQLVKETRTTIPAQSGKPERFDYQYERNGTANLFMVSNPIEGWRAVEVTNQRTAIDLRREAICEAYPLGVL